MEKLNNKKNIMIAAADGAMASQLTGVIDFFMVADQYWRIRNQSEQTLFNVNVVSPTGDRIRCSGGMTIDAIPVTQCPTPDTVIVIGGVSYDRKTLSAYFDAIEPLGKHLIKYANDNVAIASFCSATFVVAELGLLEHKQATTVWWLADLYAAMYPNITVKLDQLVTQDQNLLTAGATTSYLSLCLRIVEQLYDEHLADQLSRIMLIDPNRCSQRPYMILNTTERHHDQLVKDIQHWMGEHLAQPIYLDQIAEKFAITKRTLNRRFKKALNDTPVNYLQKLRVENAKRLLECSSLSIEQIVSKIGYEDVSSFRKLFIELVELSPKEYRERFQQGIPANINAVIHAT